MKTNLFIVGTIKAATTSIYNYLNQSNDIYFPPIKELHFFSDVRSIIDENTKFNPDKKQHSRVINTLDEYNLLYPFKDDYKYFGDCSPTYLSDENAPFKLKKYNAKAKIVIVLRHPIDRIISHYQMNLNRNVENDSFMDAIKKDLLKVNQQLFIDNKYVKLGMYGEQIERYLKCFDRKNIFILKFEDLNKDTASVVNSLLKKIGVDSLSNEEFIKKYNTYSKPIFPSINKFKKNKFLKKLMSSKLKHLSKKVFYRSKKPQFVLSEQERVYLEDIYKSDQELLHGLIGFKYF
jgi:hypothetical protein